MLAVWSLTAPSSSCSGHNRHPSRILTPSCSLREAISTNHKPGLRCWSRCPPVAHRSIQIIPTPFILQNQISLKFTLSDYTMDTVCCCCCVPDLFIIKNFYILLSFPLYCCSFLETLLSFFFFLTIQPQKPLSPLTFWFATSETLISRMQYSDRHSNLSLHSHSISIPIDNSSPGQIASLKSLSCKFPLILLLHRTFQVKPQPYINLTLPFLYLPKQLNMEKNNIPAWERPYLPASYQLTSFAFFPVSIVQISLFASKASPSADQAPNHSSCLMDFTSIMIFSNSIECFL